MLSTIVMATVASSSIAAGLPSTATTSSVTAARTVKLPWRPYHGQVAAGVWIPIAAAISSDRGGREFGAAWQATISLGYVPRPWIGIGGRLDFGTAMLNTHGWETQLGTDLNFSYLLAVGPVVRLVPWDLQTVLPFVGLDATFTRIATGAGGCSSDPDTICFEGKQATRRSQVGYNGFSVGGSVGAIWCQYEASIEARYQYTGWVGFAAEGTSVDSDVRGAGLNQFIVLVGITTLGCEK